ncbi:hypothetical protein HPB52_016032 [Rhipicephalus sanguineus]|uniref:Protein big brother n=1 Tax=Rhipicephalus sanguineus TaxID=34632 RepID=A0A9D4TAW8_RHISA|nr:hypothetical protein HPB52_016032 [Rhipicephalus sanguineus]
MGFGSAALPASRRRSNERRPEEGSGSDRGSTWPRLSIVFTALPWRRPADDVLSNGMRPTPRQHDLIPAAAEEGKQAATLAVHIKSSFIMNGVCVRYRGWIDLDRLDGVGCLEYDEERGRLEDAVLRDQIECYNQRLRDFEEKQRAFRARHERQAEAELECPPPGCTLSRDDNRIREDAEKGPSERWQS